IEETATVHELVADYIKKLNETAPPTPPTTERKDTRVYTLKQAADQVMKGLEPFLTKDVGKIVVNPALNSLIVTDMFPNFTVLERYIRELDATPQQVSIEATVIEATLDDTTDFGLSSFWQRAVGTGTLGYQGRSFNPADTVTAPSAFRSFNTGSYNFGFINGSEWEVAINALTTTTDANILSRPKVVVANNKKAELRVGTEVPYVDVQGGAAGATQGVSFKQINLSMVLTPHIEPGDRIRLEIDFKFDTQQGTANLGGAVGSGQPIVANRSIKTEVYVNDGETLVIGGLYEDRATDTINKVPLLGDLPVLGLLFRDTSTRHQKTDLLFIINPSIVRDAKVVEARAKGRRLWVYRPAAPQIPDWYRDRNYSRLSSGGSGE
ncbi:MAG: type II secretion system protein GspD, partial [Planctomycetota bacterium]